MSGGNCNISRRNAAQGRKALFSSGQESFKVFVFLLVHSICTKKKLDLRTVGEKCHVLSKRSFFNFKVFGWPLFMIYQKYLLKHVAVYYHCSVG